MPVVPTYENLRTGVAGPAGGQFNAPSGPSGSEIAGQQMQQLGQAVQGAGDMAARMQMDIQQQLNQTRVDDALNRVKEEQMRLTHDKELGYSNLRGVQALDRADGKPLSDEYADKLKTAISTTAGSLGNDVQRRAFEMHANDMLTGFRGQVMAHEAQEMKTYQASVSEGVISTAQREIAVNWQNPQAVEAATKRIGAHTYRMAQLQGKSAEWADMMARKMESDGHTLALGAALDAGKLDYAQQYLKTYGARMDANDLLRMQGVMLKVEDTHVAAAAVKQVFEAEQPRANPTDFDRLVAITLKTESNGKRYGKDGQLLTSPKGAQGEMQVMPGTNRDPGFGVKPARDSSPEELARVGRDYLGAMLKRYNGDPAKAWAAYNAGPGRLDDALKRAGGSRGAGADWLTFMPAETQAYVAKNTAALNSGERPAPPTIVDIQTRVAQTLGPNARPGAVAHARQMAEQQFADQEKARKQTEDATVASTMRLLEQNGGRWSDLPASVRGAVPPKEVDNLLGYAKKIHAGDDVTNPAVYQRLSDTNYLKTMSDDAFFAQRKDLSEADFQHFARVRGTEKAASGNKPGDIEHAALTTAINDTLRTYQIDPSPKDDGGADAARIGAIRKFITDETLRAQALAGKKFDTAELNKHVAGLFAQQGKVPTWFGLGAGETKAMLTMKTGDIPGELRDRIKADFSKQGINSPTDSQILGAYWTAKARTKSTR
jgi:soluble lytic murein transglycosylase